jgi:hypothetical protein
MVGTDTILFLGINDDDDDDDDAEAYSCNCCCKWGVIHSVVNPASIIKV